MLGRCLVGVIAAVLLAGCDSDPEMPTVPSPMLTVQPFSTATNLDQIAYRVQVRMRVTAGLADFADSVQAGRASAEVCADGCNTDPVVPGPVFGECDTAVGAATPEIAAVWLAGDEVGLDFCIPTLTVARTYTTTLRDNTQQSNAVTTACSLDGGMLVCASN